MLEAEGYTHIDPYANVEPNAYVELIAYIICVQGKRLAQIEDIQRHCFTETCMLSSAAIIRESHRQLFYGDMHTPVKMCW